MKLANLKTRPRRLRRGALEQNRLQEKTDAGAGDIEIEEEEDDMGGQPSEAKKRRTEVRDIRDRFEKLIADASSVQYCLICGGMHDIDECTTPDDEKMKDTLWPYGA